MTDCFIYKFYHVIITIIDIIFLQFYFEYKLSMFMVNYIIFLINLILYVLLFSYGNEVSLVIIDF